MLQSINVITLSFFFYLSFFFSFERKDERNRKVARAGPSPSPHVLAHMKMKQAGLFELGLSSDQDFEPHVEFRSGLGS